MTNKQTDKRAQKHNLLAEVTNKVFFKKNNSYKVVQPVVESSNRSYRVTPTMVDIILKYEPITGIRPYNRGLRGHEKFNSKSTAYRLFFGSAPKINQF